MHIDEKHKAACRQATSLFHVNPDVTVVYVGRKRKKGRKTKQLSIVVGVQRKLLKAGVSNFRLIPQSIGGVKTDVVQTGIIRAQGKSARNTLRPSSLTQRRRPCPPGYSVGHPLITAGTLGFWYYDPRDDAWYFVSNNHVIAASNDGKPGDLLLQQGKADGGISPGENFARLHREVLINFGSGGGGGKKNKKPNRVFWKTARAVPNFIARIFRCPYRLDKVTIPGTVTQPSPNLVDLSVASVLEPRWVKEDIPFIGFIQGIRDALIDDGVQKTGRTTEHTSGVIDGIGSSLVNYGAGKGTAEFDDQLIISSTGAGDFSAGGDSGSAVLDENNFLVGLLFAGGEGITIANRITHVLRLGDIPL